MRRGFKALREFFVKLERKELQGKDRDLNQYKTFDDLESAMGGPDVKERVKGAAAEGMKGVNTVARTDHYEVL